MRIGNLQYLFGHFAFPEWMDTEKTLIQFMKDCQDSNQRKFFSELYSMLFCKICNQVNDCCKCVNRQEEQEDRYSYFEQDDEEEQDDQECKEEKEQ